MGSNILDKLSQRIKEAQPSSDNGHGGAFAAGDDEGVALRQLVCGADLDECELELGGYDCGSSFAQQGQVLSNAALESQHANGDGRHC